MKSYQPDRILVERSVLESPITNNVIAGLPGVPVVEIESMEPLLEAARSETPTIPVGKRSLVLGKHRGRFFKPCPGGQARGENRNVCCDYYVLNFAANCHMECTYCYLQSYLNFPHLVIYANLADLQNELASVLDSRPRGFLRVGTGELADSLALDPLTGYSVPLVQQFSRYPDAVLELKTKSDCIERLLNLDHRGRTVVAWSISPRLLQQTEEHKTSSIDRRLQAARACALAGYRIGFHFDPLIHYPDWERDYQQLVAEIYDVVPPSSIAWFSLGALRMTPSLQEIMRKRFPGSSLALGELVPSQDGKLRYVKPIRLELYRRMISWLEAGKHPQTALYACMERPEVWSRVFGGTPPPDQAIGELVSLSVR